MSKLQLAPGLSLPLDLITMRSLVLGVSGSGKSTFGRLLAESIHAAGQRFCVIDLKNDWWGLKSSADGKSAAIPVVVIGGPRADIPLDENGGAAVADIVAELPNSFIIDLDALSKGKGIRFLGAFLERLYDVNRDPLLLICDEADRYGPQKPMSVEANVTLGAADDIARRGRKRGIGSLWLSQRPAVIAKNITSQCELVVTFRTTSSLDTKELREHIGRVASPQQLEATMAAVGGLQNGEAIFVSQHPDMRMCSRSQLPMPKTFDSSATPKVGQRRIEPKQLAAPDLAALGERIKVTVEKAKADDPKALRRRISEIEGELRKAQVAKVVDVETRVVEVPVLQGAEREHLEMLIEKGQELVSQLTGLRTNYEGVAASINSQLARVLQKPSGLVGPAPRRSGPSATARHVAPVRRDPAPDSSPDALNKPQRAILTVLAQSPAGCEASKLTLLAGYRWSGGFRNALSALRSSGLISGDNGGVMDITDAGMEAIGASYAPLPTGQALIDYWLTHPSLGSAERAILGWLISAPEGLDAAALMSGTGYTWSGGFRNALSKLRTAGLIEGKNGEVMRAHEDLLQAKQ